MHRIRQCDFSWPKMTFKLGIVFTAFPIIYGIQREAKCIFHNMPVDLYSEETHGSSSIAYLQSTESNLFSLVQSAGCPPHSGGILDSFQFEFLTIGFACSWAVLRKVTGSVCGIVRIEASAVVWTISRNEVSADSLSNIKTWLGIQQILRFFHCDTTYESNYKFPFIHQTMYRRNINA